MGLSTGTPERSGKRRAFDRLSAEDVEILKREVGPIRGHTCKIMLLEPSRDGALPTMEQLRASIAGRLDSAPRMRQRLVYTPLHVAGPVWLDDPGFELERHVKAFPAPEPVSRNQLQAVVAELMSRRLDPAHPLWELDVIERCADGSMALIWRIHHCMADGATCIRLGAEVFWTDSPAISVPSASGWRPAPSPSGTSLFVQGLADRALTRRRVHRSVPKLQSLRASAAIVRRELRRSASLTELATAVGTSRRVAFASTPLADAKHAGKAVDPTITLNDVVLTLVAGGVRAWLNRRHRSTEAIRAKVPVSLHHGQEADEAANRDSYFVVDLPVDEADPVKRLRRINHETSERKLSHDAETLYRLGAHPLVGRWSMSPRVFTFNVSNVPGPAHDVYVLSCRVREMYAVAEIAPRHALRVAVVSAAGSLFFGLCADGGVVEDLDVLADGIERSAHELLAAAG